MKRIFVGIDISKETLDVAICKNPEDGIAESFATKNTVKGIKRMIHKCTKKTDNPWFCFEHTGNYGLLLSTLLEAGECHYSAVPALEIKQSSGMLRGKTDPVDAGRIALYAATYAHKLKPTRLNAGSILQIKSLLTFRDQLTRTSTAYKNSLKSYKVIQQSVDVKDIINMIVKKIKRLESEINAIESKILAHLKTDQELIKNYKKIITVKGIGPIIASYMIVLTNNFTAFENNRKFNCYAGLAPFQISSGTSINKGSRTSKLRNKKIKTLLYNGANSAVQFDHELKAYYKRKLKEGKEHHLIMNNVAAKLVSRIFAVVKRDEPYVNIVR